MLRVILNDKPIDHTSTDTLLDKSGFLSINQMNAHIKLLETWKSMNIEKYPVKFETILHSNSDRITRGVKTGSLKVSAKSNITQATFMGDAVKVWNAAPEAIKTSKTLFSVKNQIKTFIKSIPI
jgi:hypothetical protein